MNEPSPKLARRDEHEAPVPGRVLVWILLAASLLALVVVAGSARAEDAVPADAEPAAVSAAVPLASVVRAQPLDGAVSLDAVLDEPAWQGPSAAPLVQNDPANGAAPRQRTDWWIGYDEEALYVAVRMYDSAPESITCRLARRDDWPESDMIVLNLDTQNDDRTGYTFAVNPAGCIYDNVMYNDGWDDPSWDGIWDVATRIDEEGWAAEFRIPFSQMTFPDRAEQVWGVNVSRRIHRYQERDELFHRPRGESGYVSRFPDLTGIRDIRPTKQVEVLAYATGKGEYLDVEPGNPFQGRSEHEVNTGLDLKYGLSSNLTLNATINPDFGQVEVDPAVVNLSDFETYFPERRPFFVEDANVFRFGQEGTSSNWNFNWSDPMLFYSRRVGRAPQLGLEDNDYAEAPSATTILGAAKLSGKVGGTDIGYLHAVTAEETAQLQLGGENLPDQIVEPGTQYSVLRMRRATEDGRHGLGLMATGAFRSLSTDLGRASLPRRSLVGGIDGWTKLDKGDMWAVKGFLSASRVAGDAEAIDGLQRSYLRYYQRGADHLDYDPERTSLTGWAGRVMVNKQRGEWRLNTALGAVSPGYEISDLGFQGRADRVTYHCSAGHNWNDPGRTFRYASIYLAGYESWDFGGNPTARGTGLFTWATFSNYWGLDGQFFYNPERNDPYLTRGGPVVRVPAVWSAYLNVYSDQRRNISYGFTLDETRAEDGSELTQGSLSLSLRPRSSLLITFRPQLRWHREVAQYVTQVEDASAVGTGGSRYIFGDMEYRSFNLTTRVDWTFSPRLTLQTFMQPLIAAAGYSRFKEFTRPHSYDFRTYGDDGVSTIRHDADAGSYVVAPDGAAGDSFEFDDPDFNFKSLKVNMVLRWEYHPGSTFYLVWTQDRASFVNPGSFDLGRDSRALLDAPGDDIIMVKLTHWLDL